MKNTEWGAVAYLSQSIYGSRQRVRINNNASYLTGYAAIHEPTTGYTGTNESCEKYPTACNEYGGSTKGINGDSNTNYFNPASVTASTTNNYTGIFDMSGGAWEYVMAGMEDNVNSNILESGRNSTNNSGFNGNNADKSIVTNGINLPDNPKFYDIYLFNNNGNDYSKFIPGDATGEMGPFKIVQYTGTSNGASVKYINIGSWYDNSGQPVILGAPWFNRGGGPDSGTEAGLFEFRMETGMAINYISFRLVLAFNENL